MTFASSARDTLASLFGALALTVALVGAAVVPAQTATAAVLGL
ncbi:hypothetical protein [Sphingomonas sp.]